MVGSERKSKRAGGVELVPGSGQLPTKAAERLAMRLARAIVKRRLPVGTVVGSEADLLAKYGISRAVLREAVRLLEFQSVARMRRGPGGGLIVTKPNERATTTAATMFLEYSQVSPVQIAEVRLLMELGCVEHVVRDLDDDGIARLRAVLDAETRDHTATYHSQVFHLVLAELTGNPALELFVRVLTSLTRDHAGGGSETAAAKKAVREAHMKIVDAIIERNTDLACHRMRKHLEAVVFWIDS